MAFSGLAKTTSVCNFGKDPSLPGHVPSRPLQNAVVSPQVRIVVVAVANGVCGAALAVASALGLLSAGIAILIALCVMAATWILLRRAMLDRGKADDG